MMLTPSFWSKEMPDTSSKQTTSYWHTRPRWPVAVVHEHPRHRGLPAADQVRVRTDLLKQVRLARAPRPELHHVVVALYKGHHPQQQSALLPLGELGGLDADRAEQEVLPLRSREGLAGLGERVEHVDLRELDFPQCVHAERPTVFLLRDHGVVTQRHLGVEAPGEHPLVFVDLVAAHAHIP